MKFVQSCVQTYQQASCKYKLYSCSYYFYYDGIFQLISYFSYVHVVNSLYRLQKYSQDMILTKLMKSLIVSFLHTKACKIRLELGHYTAFNCLTI